MFIVVDQFILEMGCVHQNQVKCDLGKDEVHYREGRNAHSRGLSLTQLHLVRLY